MRIKDLNEEPTKREIEKAEQDARILAQLRGTAKKDSFYDDPSRFISPDRKHKLIHDPEKNVAITKGPSGKKTSGDHAFSGIHNVTPVPTTGPGAAETSTVTSTNPASQAATQHGSAHAGAPGYAPAPDAEGEGQGAGETVAQPAPVHDTAEVHADQKPVGVPKPDSEPATEPATNTAMQAKAEHMAAEDAKRAELKAKLDAQIARIEAAKNNIEAIKDREQARIDDVDPRTDRTDQQIPAEVGGGDIADYDIPTNLLPAAQKILDQMETGGLTQADIQAALDKWVASQVKPEPYIDVLGSEEGLSQAQDAVDAIGDAEPIVVTPGPQPGETDSSKQEHMTKQEAAWKKEADEKGQTIINGGFNFENGVENSATEHKNPVIRERAKKQLAALTAAVSSAGIINPETGQLTPLGYSLKQGDDGAWAAYTAQDVTADKNAAQLRAVAIMAAVSLGLITAPAWLPAVATTSSISAGLTSPAAIKAAAATLGLGGTLTTMGASADDSDSETTDTSSFWGDPNSVFKKGKDWGYEPEINRLIDKVQKIGEKIYALGTHGDPAKREELYQENRNIVRLIRHMKKAQELAAGRAVVAADRAQRDKERAESLAAYKEWEQLEPFGGKGPDADYSHIRVPELTAGQLEYEIGRIGALRNQPGITRERYNELDKKFLELKKQQRKNRRSNESLDKVSRARQLRS